jgi:hypothetical protein
MENISVRRWANLLLALALLPVAFAACQKKTETAPAPAAPTPAKATPAADTPAASSAPTAQGAAVTPPTTGPMTPALVSQGADAITQYLHFPKDSESALANGAVQFYCDITPEGTVTATQALIGSTDAFRNAVQTALDWGRFTPATIDQKPVPVYLGGTVLFLHENGEEVIVVSLTTDRDRVRKMTNYIQPQLIGGLRPTMERAIDSLRPDNNDVSGKAEVMVTIDEHGALTATSKISESPKGSGLGTLLENALKGAQFTPAYDNAKPASGTINVVADFDQF